MSRKEILGKEEFSLLRWTSTDEDIPRKEYPLPSIPSEKRRKKKVRLKRSHRNNRDRSSSRHDCCGLKQSPMYLCWFEDLNGLRLNLVLFSFLLTVILLVVFAVHLHSQIYSIQKTLVEERKLTNDNHHRYHKQIQEIMANQSMITNNITLLYQLYHNYSSQMTKLGSVVNTLVKTLESAPELKSLPKDMQDTKKNLAKFGSHLTDLDSRVTELEKKLANNVAEIAHTLNTTLRKRDDESYESFVRNIVQENIQPLQQDMKHLDEYRRIFETNITEQFKSQEINFAQNLKLMNELEDNMKNVTKANEKNEDNFKKIMERLQKFDESKRSP